MEGIVELDDFMAHIPDNGEGFKCLEVTKPCKQNSSGYLRIFGYRPMDTNTSSTPQTPSMLIQTRVQAAMSSLQLILSDDVMVQYWAPRWFTSNEKIMPTVLQQPFGIKGLRNGLCKYRIVCSNHMLKVRDIADLGPPGRVFTSGSPELCDDIGCYSLEEFPLRDLAKFCGIKSYQAYPLFQQWNNRQSCVGVLEFVSLKSYMSRGSSENKEFSCTSSSHSVECKKVHCHYVSSHHDVLQVLKKPIQLIYSSSIYRPIQFWVPCTCENGNNSSKITQLFCQLPWFHWDTKYSIDQLHQLNFHSTTHFVKIGKSWVGRACLLNKICFFSDISRLSITDYPLPCLVRSTRLISSCFAIPLPLLHPSLPPLILEAFITQKDILEENLEEQLKNILTNMAKEISKHNTAFEFKSKEKFIVELSHSDDENFVYFNVYRREGIRAMKKSKQNDLQVILDAIRSRQNYWGDNQNSTTLDKGGSSFTKDEAEIITLDTIKGYFGRNIEDVAKELKVSRSTLKRRCRTLGIRRWPSHKRFNKVNDLGQTPIKVLDEEEDSSEFDQESMAAGARDKEAESILMTISATYEDDVVNFPFQLNSGIEELCFALAKRFKLETGENFKINLGDEGKLILISCDEDLHFHMSRVKSSGRNVINLSVVLLTL